MFRQHIWQRYFIFAVIVSMLVLSISPLGVAAQDNTTTPNPASPATVPASKGKLIVGSKDFTENVLVGKMLINLLRNAGYEVEDKTDLGGSAPLRAALEKGEIDLYPEYTGTAITVYHNLPASALPAQPNAVYELAKSLDAAQGLIWLAPANFNDTYALMVRKDIVDKGIQSISQLADYMNVNDSALKLCVESEFYSRTQDGIPALQTRYGFAFKPDNVLLMDLDAAYDALRKGDCDVSEGFSTDGRGAAWGFTNLADNLNFFPFYNPAPVVRQAVLQQYPEIETILNKLAPLLDTATMAQLNARVDIGDDGNFNSGDEAQADSVALKFLQDKGLVASPSLVVGSKDFTENVLVGKMYTLLLRNAGFTVEDRTDLGGTAPLRDALEKGEIDLYPEYTGTAVTVFHKLPGVALPTDATRMYELARSLDGQKGLIWLAPAQFNDTYALMVRQETADKGIKTLADLADFMNKNDSPLTVCAESEFYSRQQDGLPALEKRYGFNFKPENVLLMDLDEAYKTLREGKCDISEGFSTDGRGAAWGFVNLEDTLNFFPFYNPAPVIRKAVLDQQPDIAAVLEPLSALLDTTTMSQLNARVDIGADNEAGTGDEETADAVAYSFLWSHRLVKPPAITVASKDYTEQLLLGNMVALLLQNAGYEVVNKIGMGSSKIVRAAQESGEVDLYVELTGSALTVHNQLPVEALPTSARGYYALARALDAKKDLVWLTPGAFNDTYALMVRDDLWEKNIRSIADLAQYMNETDSPLTICLESDFYGRENDGLPALQTQYGFAFKEENLLLMEVDQVYSALKEGQCDIGEGFSTDGRIVAWGFHNLQDNLNFFPFYNPAPVVRRSVLTANPELADILAKFGDLLDDTTMSQLNARVDIGPDGEVGTGDEEKPEAVARAFLLSVGLIKASTEGAGSETPPAPASPSTGDATSDTSITNNPAPADTAGAGTLSLTATLPITTPVSTPVATLVVTATNLTVKPTLAPTVATTSTPTIAPTVAATVTPRATPTVGATDTPKPTDTPTSEAAATQAPTTNALTTVNSLSFPTEGNVNARVTANIEAAVLVLLPKGTVLKAIGRTANNEWLQIVLPNGRAAWVYTTVVLEKTNIVQQLPVVTPPPSTN